MKLVKRWEAVLIWLNADVAVRRIDVVLVLIGIGIASYEYFVYGWQTAVIGILMYVFVTMIAVWIL